MKDSGDAMVNVLLPETSSSMFGGGSLIIWEGCTDLYVHANSIRYWDKILRAIVRPYADAVGPWFLLVPNIVQPHVASSV